MVGAPGAYKCNEFPWVGGDRIEGGGCLETFLGKYIFILGTFSVVSLRGHITNFPLKNIGCIFNSMNKNSFEKTGLRLVWPKQIRQNI